MRKRQTEQLNIEEQELYRLCDYVLRETGDPIAAFFLSDGSIRIGIGKANEGETKFHAIPFDALACQGKQVQFWENASEQSFYPKNLIVGRPGEGLSCAPEDATQIRDYLVKSRAVTQSKSPTRAWKKEEDRAGWNAICAHANNAIAKGEIDKLVPARTVHAYSSGLSWENYFTRLRDRSGKNTHRFLWRTNVQIFLGASPELLVRNNGDELIVPAIAGTRAYKESERAAAQELLDSEKESREHEIVVRDITEKLSSLGLSPLVGARELLVLPGLVHLFTPVMAKLGGRFSLLEAVKALHPTPAMGGHPRQQARALLAKRENWDRGYYASPLGFVDEDGSGAFVVGIRSALFSKERVTVFAGAGYVLGSDPEKEWQETTAKMRGMLEVFGI